MQTHDANTSHTSSNFNKEVSLLNKPTLDASKTFNNTLQINGDEQ